jgi:phenylpropionate dioxygenase-like ring-hydroxylating dioxygenase large terminal subunit
MTVTELRTDEPVGTAITTTGSAKGSPTRVPASRYTSPEFAAREMQLMWPRVWVVACSVDHVADPGDYFEYRIGQYSVLLVRGDDGSLRAFQNVCRHRGNVICEGAGGGLTELRCVYHRWSWDLQGRLREVPSRKGFGTLRNDDFPLLPAQVGTWGRLVFVNLDLDAMPLADYLEGMPDDIAWVGLDDFRCTYSVTTPIPANWKVISDGFSETYHVQGLHSEMLGSIDDINSGQHIWGHVGFSKQPYGVPSPRLGRGVPDQVVWDSFIVTQGGRMGVNEKCPAPTVPEGQTLQDVIAEGVRRKQEARGVDLTRFSTAQVLTLNQYNVFPNTTILISADMLTVMHSGPGATPDDGTLTIMHFDRAADSKAPRTRPMDAAVPFGEANFGHVLNQDTDVLRTAQRGLHQPGFTHLTLSSEEARLINTHHNLERYLGISPSEMTGGPVRD